MAKKVLLSYILLFLVLLPVFVHSMPYEWLAKESSENNVYNVKRALLAALRRNNEVGTRKRDCTDSACEFAIWGKRDLLDGNNIEDMEDVNTYDDVH